MCLQQTQQHCHVTQLRGSCLGGVWQRDSSLPRVVWLIEIPARSLLSDLRKGGQSQLNTSVGRVTTLHWSWSKNRWRIGRIDVSLLVSLLGQRSVICSSEWPYLQSNRAHYCSFICLCLWTCSLGGCFCTVCTSCIFPSDFESLVMEPALADLPLRFFNFPYFADSALILCQSLLFSHQQKESLHSTLYLHRWRQRTASRDQKCT